MHDQEDTQTSYQYEPLSEPSDIRILTLEPSDSWESDICCQFTVLNLVTAVNQIIAANVEGLSYIWGRDAESNSIKVAG